MPRSPGPVAMHTPNCLAALLFLALAVAGLDAAVAAELADLVDRVRPGVVGVGTVDRLRSPPNDLRGTGFVVADGRHVVTNAHVVTTPTAATHKEYWAVFAGRGAEARVRPVEILARDDVHDLALLRFEGEALPALEVDAGLRVREGSAIAFTGFPIGAVLGLYPVTHAGIVSAISPAAVPVGTARTLTAQQVKLRREPWDIYQLDAVAYPGNSGSPVWETTAGRVVAVLNQVLVKQTRENVLRDPSGIAYAIPAAHVRALIDAHVPGRAR